MKARKKIEGMTIGTPNLFTSIPVPLTPFTNTPSTRPPHLCNPFQHPTTFTPPPPYHLHPSHLPTTTTPDLFPSHPTSPHLTTRRPNLNLFSSS
ncbi:hypothetical protein Pmani_013797 [Petrolisthes manimaculis]|uniref:Uncharacterized protein n=1 Tax=Petrolisthes manimaculis TaxID=1843537 RepID=A0AAE1U901_9EUCA|nr:hypothetical protein Pmani_013797 [Petrolisthes manimaculis]